MTISKMSSMKAPPNGVSTDNNTKGMQQYGSISTMSFTLAKAFFLGAAAIITVIFLSSCARKAVFQVSPVVPAARGYTKVKKDHNKNYNIYVSLEDLAEPNRLTPAKQSYVVWIVANDNSTKNVGQVKTSTGLMSHTLKGSLETVSASKPVKVFITAEDDATVQFPSAMLVMTTNEF